MGRIAGGDVCAGTHLPERMSSGCSFTSIALSFVCSSRVWMNRNSVVEIAISATNSLVLQAKYTLDYKWSDHGV
jgi:hypothetical protein